MQLKNKKLNCIVIKKHTSSPDPLILHKGEEVRVGREFAEDPDWQDWVECTNRAGNTGWIPKQFLDISGDSAVTLRDYDATELNVNVGEHITVLELENGWAWAHTENGKYGWVPLRNLKIE